MCIYYAKFVLQCVYVSAQLYNLLCKNMKFDWTKDRDTAFKQLKHAFVHAPILDLPDFDANFVVKTDDSGMEVGAALIQHDHFVAFILKALNSAQ